ncbi:hypothetical protein AVEN_50791-1 [Araneus ventricosus]|uniref:Uncharacterized protein n=1 Tax=Araneus ventricosus TaxID=182803 RepID=A0A4Y2WXP4_ARAVE|nr:hypothetical protein AVEN_50791-1 [Araneus ventricosus]
MWFGRLASRFKAFPWVVGDDDRRSLRDLNHSQMPNTISEQVPWFLEISTLHQAEGVWASTDIMHNNHTRITVDNSDPVRCIWDEHFVAILEEITSSNGGYN